MRQSSTRGYHTCVELTPKSERLAFSFVGFIFDMKEYYWLKISRDGGEPMLAAMLRQALWSERANQLMVRLVVNRTMRRAAL